MVKKRMIISILCILFCLTNVSSETHHEYIGEDTSEDGIKLNSFFVEGGNELINGAQLHVNFTLQNDNDAEIPNFKVNIATERPNGTIIYTHLTTEETFNPLEEITVNSTINLNESGSWSIWPSYEFYTSSVTTAPKRIIGPDYWQSYNVTIENAKADLLISEVNCEWENNKIVVVLENSGQVDITKDFGLALFVNDEKKQQKTISSLIPAKKQIVVYFDVKNIFHGNSVDIIIQVDNFNEIEEKNEKNNEYQIDCFPVIDKTPPVFISRPTVDDITESSVVINWKTDEISNGAVKYSQTLGKYEKNVNTIDFNHEHSVMLKDLKADSIYHAMVEVWDQHGNKQLSDTFFFTTKTRKDTDLPTIQLPSIGQISGPITIKANASDNSGINQVSFTVNGDHIYTAYSPPYQCYFNGGDYEDGIYDLQVDVVDTTGNSNLVQKDLIIQHSIPKVDIDDFPNVTIVSPEANAEYFGNILINALINHTELIERVEFFIDGVLWHTSYGYSQAEVVDPWGNRIPIYGDALERPFNKSFQWYLKSLEEISILESTLIENKSTLIEVRAYDTFDVRGKDTITVYHAWEAPRTPSLEIQREVYRVDNYLVMNVTIYNHGFGSAEMVSLTDKHYGFQIGEFISSNQPATYEISNLGYNIQGSSSGIPIRKPVEIMTVHLNSNLSGMDQWSFSYELFPLFTNNMQYNWFEIAAYSQLNYDGRTEYLNGPYEPTPHWTEQMVYQAFEQADYLIVTNPLHLYGLNPNAENVNELLSTITELAREKKGAIGYILFDLTANDIHSEINNWGKQYLNQSWKSQGYLLIVGETEIIPSFTARWNYDFDTDDETIYCTDYPYANTKGKTIMPELHIGRIIGNTCINLTRPLQASLNVHYATSTFKRGYETGAKALCLSGGGNGEGTFWSHVNNVASILTSAGYQTISLREANYGLRLFNELCSNSDNQSVIYYRNHGNADGQAWTDVITSYPFTTRPISNISFGRTHPLIFACCCCAGQYEHNPNYDSGGENGIAEGFFDQGAGIYIGSTEISARDLNGVYSRDFFNRWAGNPGKTIAQAWKETRRKAADEWWFENDRFWSAEYQFYGDPKFGE